MGVKKTTLRGKLGAAFGLGTLFIVMLIVGYATYQVREVAIAGAEKQVRAEVDNFTNRLQAIIENALDASRSFSNSLSIVGSSQYHGHLTREEVQAMGEAIFLSNRDFIGFSIAFEPNAFDEKDHLYVDKFAHDHTGRFVTNIALNDHGEAEFEALLGYEGSDDDARWYWMPKQKKLDFMEDPAYYKMMGKEILMISCMTPILYNDRFLGATGVDFSVDFIQKMTQELDIYDGQFDLSVISSGGIYASSHKHPEWIGKRVHEVQKSLADAIMKNISDAKPNRII